MNNEQNIFIKWDSYNFRTEITYVFNLDNHHIVEVINRPLTRHGPCRTGKTEPKNLLWKGDKIGNSQTISSIKNLAELIVNKYLEIGWDYSLEYKRKNPEMKQNSSVEIYLIDFKKKPL